MTTKVAETRGCQRCCVGRNPYNGYKYLCGILPTGIFLMQWYDPLNKFMLLKVSRFSSIFWQSSIIFISSTGRRSSSSKHTHTTTSVAIFRPSLPQLIDSKDTHQIFENCWSIRGFMFMCYINLRWHWHWPMPNCQCQSTEEVHCVDDDVFLAFCIFSRYC